MNAQEKSDLKTRLEERIAVLSTQLPALKEATRPIAPDSALGRLTRMEAIQDKAISENTLLQVTLELNAIKKTLDLIDDPAFGICVECEQPIPAARLMAIPGTQLCVSCAV